MLTIYRLDWVSWNGGKLSDPNLPRTLGYFQTIDGAEARIQSHMASKNVGTDETLRTEAFVTPEDYWIVTVCVA